MKYSLRDYQQEFVEAVKASFLTGYKGQGPFQRVLGLAATGAGKTIMASALVYWQHKEPRRRGRVLMLADTDELVAQAADKIYKSTGLFPDIEKASERASLNSMIVVGSIQTMSNRLEKWPSDHFDLVIADEAHLSMAANWQKVLGHFQEGSAWILGITATPERSDGQDLMDYYEHLAAEIGLFDLIERGHLAPLTVEVCPVEIDCRALKAQKRGINAGNFKAEEIEESLDPYLERIIDQWQERASERQTLVFHSSIASSKKFTGLLQARGITAGHVDGNSKDRKEILTQYERGDFQVLNNANLLIKGYDCPPIECVINLAPGKSRTAYQQKIGRGTRLFEGKEDCLILDFLWQFEELGMMRPADLISDGEKAGRIAEIMERGDRVTFKEASEAAEKEREQKLLKRLQMAQKRGKGHVFNASTLAALIHQPSLDDYEPRAGWEKKEISPAQQRFLTQTGIDTASVKGLGHALQISGALANRRSKGKATPQQLAAMAQLEIDFDQETTFSQAQAKLNRAK